MVESALLLRPGELWREHNTHLFVCFTSLCPVQPKRCQRAFVWFNSLLIQTVCSTSTTVVIISGHNTLHPKSYAKTNQFWHFQLFITAGLIFLPLNWASYVTQWLICQPINDGNGVLIVKDDCSCNGVTNWFMVRKAVFFRALPSCSLDF